MNLNTPPPPEDRFYLVRTNENLIGNGVVGVGWSDFDFSKCVDAADAINAINGSYGVGRSANQIRRFFEIRDGDYIVAPIPYAVVIGRARGGLFFDSAYENCDRANQRKVEFLRDREGQVISIPRASFSEAFQRRLRVQGMTVNDLSAFGEEILAAYQSVASGKDHSWRNPLLAQIEQRREEFKRKLLNNIQSGKTNLLTGGLGLEQLVRELLTCDGYQARILSKQRFGSFADADVQASRTDRCASIDLLVQVKHHQGDSDMHGIHQLLEIQKAHPGEFDDHQQVFVTSGTLNDDARRAAEASGITVIAGADLAGWISEHIDDLSEDTKLALGICEVPAVL